MKFTYKDKEYNVIKVTGNWKVFSSDLKTTKEEATEIIKVLEDLEKHNNERILSERKENG